MKEIKLQAKKLFDETKELIDNNSIIFLGEIHGTKEIPLILTDYFKILNKRYKFNIAFEIPSNNQEYINNLEIIKFFKENKNSDGRNSLEYLNLIKSINKNTKIFFVDMPENDEFKEQNDRERTMCGNILKNQEKNKKLFVIMGNIHVSKQEININNNTITPTAYLVTKKVKKVVSINITPLSGEYYNMSIKKIKKVPDENKKNSKWDHQFLVAKVTVCSFLK